jgi:DNA mismatch repair protein MutS
VREWKGSVVFLHEVIAGSAGRSFGVHVARLAGVPEGIVRRAAALLAELERRAGRLDALEELPLFAHAAPEPAPDPLREALARIEPDRLTPREALTALYELKSMLSVADPQEPLPSA